jgi:fructokinase
MRVDRPTSPSLRIGIDLGGTKIAAIALGPADRIVAELRIPSPRDDYRATVDAIGNLVTRLEATAGDHGTIGIGMPGSISPATGRVQGSNSTWLNGQMLARDLEARIGRPIRLANDANCFALSEASDGAAAGARSVFGVIIGTGCGGGLVLDGRLLDGPNAISGEWGHNPLPWATQKELPGPLCWCGRSGCMETWVSGPALSRDHAVHTGQSLSAETIASLAADGNSAAQASLARYARRLARGLAHVVNLVDPEVIVLGGGLSNLATLYAELPAIAAPYIFAAAPRIEIRRPRWGDASGVRGAARLW